MSENNENTVAQGFGLERYGMSESLENAPTEFYRSQPLHRLAFLDGKGGLQRFATQGNKSVPLGGSAYRRYENASSAVVSGDDWRRGSNGGINLSKGRRLPEGSRGSQRSDGRQLPALMLWEAEFPSVEGSNKLSAGASVEGGGGWGASPWANKSSPCQNGAWPQPSQLWANTPMAWGDTIDSSNAWGMGPRASAAVAAYEEAAAADAIAASAHQRLHEISLSIFEEQGMQVPWANEKSSGRLQLDLDSHTHSNRTGSFASSNRTLTPQLHPTKPAYKANQVQQAQYNKNVQNNSHISGQQQYLHQNLQQNQRYNNQSNQNYNTYAAQGSQRQMGHEKDAIQRYETAIYRCNKERQWQKALRLLKDMQTHGPPPTVRAYTSAISACAKVGQSQKAIELLSEMRQANVMPNVLSYSAAISACEKARKCKQALELLNEMKANAVEPDVITYNAVISACEKARKWKYALNLMEEMKERGVKPDVITYSAAISACEKGGKLDCALQLLEDLKKDGVKPDVILFNAAISACDKRGNYQQVKEIIDQMKTAGVEPDVISYSTAISACDRGNNSEYALELFQLMKDNHVEPNSMAFHAVIRACEKDGKHEIVESLKADMKRRNIPMPRTNQKNNQNRDNGNKGNISDKKSESTRRTMRLESECDDASTPSTLPPSDR